MGLFAVDSLWVWPTDCRYKGGLMDILTQLYDRRKELQSELNKVQKMIVIAGGKKSGGTGKKTGRHLSAAGRKAISQAVKERWAKFHAKSAKKKAQS